VPVSLLSSLTFCSRHRSRESDRRTGAAIASSAVTSAPQVINNFHELSMREARRVDLRNGVNAKRVMADEEALWGRALDSRDRPSATLEQSLGTLSLSLSSHLPRRYSDERRPSRNPRTRHVRNHPPRDGELGQVAHLSLSLSEVLTFPDGISMAGAHRLLGESLCQLVSQGQWCPWAGVWIRPSTQTQPTSSPTCR
jgi:hypothetical protein